MMVQSAIVGPAVKPAPWFDVTVNSDQAFCLHSNLACYNTTMIWKPRTFFAVAVAGWVSRQQQEVIAYLREENRILLTIEQKRRNTTG